MIQSAAVSFIERRKKFPDKVTNVKPIAIIPTSAASLMIVLKLKMVKKFGAVAIPTIKTTRNRPIRQTTKAE
ncbi:MAG: hypothetical protein F4044_05460 [Rhodobacteraceae bacterium]|nr:hypothetical protein [Paracoccaceae bacterium]